MAPIGKAECLTRSPLEKTKKIKQHQLQHQQQQQSFCMHRLSSSELKRRVKAKIKLYSSTVSENPQPDTRSKTKRSSPGQTIRRNSIKTKPESMVWKNKGISNDTWSKNADLSPTNGWKTQNITDRSRCLSPHFLDILVREDFDFVPLLRLRHEEEDIGDEMLSSSGEAELIQTLPQTFDDKIDRCLPW